MKQQASISHISPLKYIDSSSFHLTYIEGRLLLLGFISLLIGDGAGLFYKVGIREYAMRIVPLAAYAVAGMSLLILTIHLIYSCCKNWTRMLAFLDMTAIAVALLFSVSIWNGFISESFININSIDLAYITSIMIADFSILSGVIVLASSVTMSKLPLLWKVIKLGLILFPMADVTYHVLILSNNRNIGCVFQVIRLMIIIIAVIGVCINNKKRFINGIIACKELPIKETGYKAVLMIPVAAASMKVYFENKNMVWNFTLIGIALCYYISATFIRNMVIAEELDRKEKMLESSLGLVKPIQVMKLEYLANRDTLTKLYNRRFFMDKTAEEATKQKSGHVLAVIMLGIKRFKVLNDIYGQETADDILKEVAARMNRWNTFGAVMAHYGEDEFAIAISGKYTRYDIDKFVGMLFDEIEQPYTLEERKIKIFFNGGISIYPKYTKDGLDLVRHADIAMSYAKSLDLLKYVFFDKALYSSEQKKEDMEALLKTANRKKRFELYYQPQFRISDKKLIGAQVFVRLKIPAYRGISQDEFIPMAEKLGIISDIGEWTMMKAFAQINRWNNKYAMHLQAGINISSRQLIDKEFVSIVADSIDKTRVNPLWINMNISESRSIQEEYKMEKAISYLRSRNIAISFDEFGKGRSSLNYLQRNLFNRIKIDKSLTDDICTDKDNRRMVTAMISVAKSIGIKTMAEGVGSQKQLDILTQLGCDEVQGLFLGKPVSAKHFEEHYIKAFAKRLSSLTEKKGNGGDHNLKKRTTA